MMYKRGQPILNRVMARGFSANQGQLIKVDKIPDDLAKVAVMQKPRYE